MNSNMVKPGKFGHLQLVYHFTVPLKLLKNTNYRKKISKHVERNIYKSNEVLNLHKKEKK